MPNLRALSAVAIVLAALASPSAAQQSPPPSRTAPVEVLVLGTYHFANPGLDVIITKTR